MPIDTVRAIAFFRYPEGISPHAEMMVGGKQLLGASSVRFLGENVGTNVFALTPESWLKLKASEADVTRWSASSLTRETTLKPLYRKLEKSMSVIPISMGIENSSLVKVPETGDFEGIAKQRVTMSITSMSMVATRAVGFTSQ